MTQIASLLPVATVLWTLNMLKGGGAYMYTRDKTIYAGIRAKHAGGLMCEGGGVIAGFYGTCVHVFNTSVADTIDSKHTWLALAEKFALGGGSVAVPRSCRYI